MKNFKISKKVKALVLAGAAFVLGGITYNGFQNEDGTFYGSTYSKAKLTYSLITSDDVPLTKVIDYQKYIIDNNLVLYEEGKKELEENYRKDGEFYQKKMYDEIKGYRWDMISKEELENFSGIFRKSDNIEYKTYTIENSDNKINKTRVYNKDEDRDYYINLNDPMKLKNTEEYYCYEGNIGRKIR